MIHRIYLHMVWTTRDRQPLIDGDRAGCLERLLPQVAALEGGKLLAIGIVRDHLHLLLRVHPRFSSARFVQRSKSVSALLARRECLGDPTRPLRWAKGYSVTSVGPRGVPAALRYVVSQALRHPGSAINLVAE